tara:strand:+ start:317 stop:964 length:648 start_codon:yes stop_codon:yes gene_type:complete
MSFTYSSLKTAIQNYLDNSETTFVDTLDTFIKNAEEDIIKNVEMLGWRNNVTGTATTGSAYLGMPSDYLSPYSLAVISSNVHYYLQLKHVTFIRDYTPAAATTGRPKYYGQFDQDTFILAPTPDATYTFELHYLSRPSSLTAQGDSGTTYISVEASDTLLYGCLTEAARFMKLDQSEIGMLENEYMQRLARLKNWSEGKQSREETRYDRLRNPIN